LEVLDFAGFLDLVEVLALKIFCGVETGGLTVVHGLDVDWNGVIDGDGVAGSPAGFAENELKRDLAIGRGDGAGEDVLKHSNAADGINHGGEGFSSGLTVSGVACEAMGWSELDERREMGLGVHGGGDRV
jgi:hypothetical protein